MSPTYYHRYTVKHEGLNKYRVVSGATDAEARQKAGALLAQWEAQWQKIQQAERAKSDKERKSASAERRTRDAQAALQALDQLLSTSLKQAVFDWPEIMDHRRFAAPEPALTFADREPQRADPAFALQIGFLDKWSSGRRQKRTQEMDAAFQTAHDAWQRRRDEAMAQHEQALQTWMAEQTEFVQQQNAHNQQIRDLLGAYTEQAPSAVCEYCAMLLDREYTPGEFPSRRDLDYRADTRTLIVEYQLPAVGDLPTVREVRYVASRDELKESHIPQTETNRLYDAVLYQLALRTIHAIVANDGAGAIDAVVFNGWVDATDAATGRAISPCIMSLHVTAESFRNIELANVDPKQCFRGLKGVGSARLHSMTAVAPVIQIDRADKRFVQAHDVLDQVDEGDNLAAMDWEDFEHLVRELFEKEFASTGGEVKVTQASRDGGVDAVAFDPDPIRGGKIVIQAKRYTHVVGVSAVRDLYGTVVNEGATKGILVTTSDYGPDAHEFAKGKPLTLLSGAHLLHLLAKHNYRARIDLQEARRLLADSE